MVLGLAANTEARAPTTSLCLLRRPPYYWLNHTNTSRLRERDDASLKLVVSDQPQRAALTIPDLCANANPR